MGTVLILKKTLQIVADNPGLQVKEEADSFAKEGKYELALKAYDSALLLDADKDMKTKLQLNKCKCLYKLNQYELCIEEARKILLLNEVNGRSLSYLWFSLSQSKIS